MANGKYDHVEGLFFVSAGMINMSDDKIATGFILDHSMDTPPFKADSVLGFRLVAITLKGLSKGTHIHIKDSRFQPLLRPFFCHKGFLDSMHAAYGGTKVGVELNVT